MVDVYSKISNFVDGLARFYSDEEAYNNLVKYVTTMLGSEGIAITVDEAKRVVDELLGGKNLFKVRGRIYFGTIDEEVVRYDAVVVVLVKDWKIKRVGDVNGYYPVFEVKNVKLI